MLRACRAFGPNSHASLFKTHSIHTHSDLWLTVLVKRLGQVAPLPIQASCA